MTGPNEVAELRRRLEALDGDLVTLAAERVGVARAIGEVKLRHGLPTLDYARERAVLERARAGARERGLDEAVAEDLLVRLIRASVTAQERDRVQGAAVGAGKGAVIVGGAGRMGAWFVRFLEALGYGTAILDPAVARAEHKRARAALPTADLVICATPPRLTGVLYDEWCVEPPAGVVADIASVKTPLIEPIARLRAAGARVASLHPLFGPETVLLRGADVVVCDTGDTHARAAVESLFAPTTARLVRLSLVEHDRVMADLLALAHAVSLTFALALPAADHAVRSTTFRALERIAAGVVRESPAVYYEIQAANPHAAAVLERLREALERLAAVVALDDLDGFVALMSDGRARTPEPVNSDQFDRKSASRSGAPALDAPGPSR